jgi:nicotinate-nucleotide pyrophosphorylase (carboxylating)
MNYQEFIDDLISLLIKEDIGDGDHSSLSTIPPDARGKMKLLVKQDGIIAGIEIARQIFNRIDKNIKIVEQLLHDGDKIKFGDIAFFVEGRILSLLQSERLVLNVMQHMSGIATQTSIYMKQIEGLKTKILDTRKTMPGMRALDKMAVKIGGGENHRMGLFDMILLKDNHIDFAGGIENAIIKAQNYLKQTGRSLKIEVEARSIDDIKKIMQIGGVDIIMLDNFDIETTRQAVKLIDEKYKTESSGGITIDNLRDYAECGVDFISVGALTHHIKSLDLSLKAVSR